MDSITLLITSLSAYDIASCNDWALSPPRLHVSERPLLRSWALRGLHCTPSSGPILQTEEDADDARDTHSIHHDVCSVIRWCCLHCPSQSSCAHVN